MHVEKKNANHDIYDKALKGTESSKVLVSFVVSLIRISQMRMVIFVWLA